MGLYDRPPWASGDRNPRSCLATRPWTREQVTRAVPRPCYHVFTVFFILKSFCYILFTQVEGVLLLDTFFIKNLFLI